jgi:16S rRNA uridine-516 pseudouridylate synthase and related pseudouridylate synthases
MTQRLNKLISDSGLCSRREADRFIESGRVTINGSIAKLGAIVQEDDKVLVDGFPINIKAVAIRVAKGKQNNAQSTTSNKLSHRAKSILAQQMAAAPKSAALRKTSKNNPANKPKVEEEEIQTPPYKKFYQKGEGYKPSFASKKTNSPEREGEEGKKIHSSNRFHDSKSPGAHHPEGKNPKRLERLVSEILKQVELVNLAKAGRRVVLGNRSNLKVRVHQQNREMPSPDLLPANRTKHVHLELRAS